MTERDVKELLGHMVLQLREAEMELERRSARISELEAENAALKADKEKQDEHA